MEGRLYKSSTDKIIDGVCGGIAEYFDIDPSIVRLIWALAVFVGGTGVFLYIIAAIILPRDVDVEGYKKVKKERAEEDISESREMVYVEDDEGKKEKDKNSKNIVGIILIALGVLLFFRRFFYIFDFRFFWPIVLVGLGFYLIFRERGN